MKSFFDTMVLEILPSLRAMMARRLMDNGFSQTDVAELLGVSQSAISHYKRSARGKNIAMIESNPKLLDRVNSLARRMANAQLSPKRANIELFDLCRDMLEASA